MRISWPCSSGESPLAQAVSRRFKAYQGLLLEGDVSKTIDRLNKQAVEVKREAIRELLDQCSESQVAAFGGLYGSVDSIPETKLNGAIQLCDRTIAQNGRYTKQERALYLGGDRWGKEETEGGIR